MYLHQFIVNNMKSPSTETPLDLSASSRPHEGSSCSSIQIPIPPSFPPSPKYNYTISMSNASEHKEPHESSSHGCELCGQVFSLPDRLAKHVASKHKIKAPSDPASPSSKSYFCDVCKRSFARSDMLTRHMRLHTGMKPYSCRVCGQVFSRSDHLSTHQRTHTGEKPYKCPICPYSACRKDMITRHMKTHSPALPQLK